MKAGTTDIDVSTRIRVTESNDPDLVGVTGTITHPFGGLMQAGSSYAVGIYLDKKGVFADDIANLLISDKFEIIDSTDDNDTVPRKWEYIATRLKEINAPDKVVNAAIEIDNAMVRLGLGYNTTVWVNAYPHYVSNPPDTGGLYDIVMDRHSCSACVDSGYMCFACKLGSAHKCTPRSKHADKYFTIMKNWTKKKSKEEGNWYA